MQILLCISYLAWLVSAILSMSPVHRDRMMTHFLIIFTENEYVHENLIFISDKYDLGVRNLTL
jgi:hypothetical protein